MKGYSVERANANSDYVMAGSSLSSAGVHFVSTDKGGVIQYSNEIVDAEHNVIPVDIAVAGSNLFYITCIATSKDPLTSITDRTKLRVYSVDFTGAVLSTFDLKAGFDIDEDADLFPVHTLYLAGDLYVCGWATRVLVSSGWPYTPSASAGNKYGMLLKVDPGAQSVSNQYFWNTTASGSSPYDFDMATRMKLLTNGDLFVTGAMNRQTSSNAHPSFILGMRFNLSSFTQSWLEGIAPSSAVSGDQYYGIDAWEGPSNEIYVAFNSATSTGSRWGVTVFESNGAISITDQNVHTYPGFDSWANQALIEGTPSGFDINIVGQQTDYLCAPISSAAPSVTNVNPFVSNLSFSYNTTTQALSTTLNSFITQGSNAGTQSTTADYLTANGFLGDVSRFYTFAVGDDPSLSITEYLIVTPIHNVFGTPGYLGFKFNRLPPSGQQPNCNNDTWSNDCPTAASVDFPTTPAGTTTVDDFIIETRYFTFGEHVISYTQTACSHYYRLAGGASPISDAQSKPPVLLSLTPNPARSKVTLSFSSFITTASEPQLWLTDAIGRRIIPQQTRFNGSSSVDVDLPELATGCYYLHADFGNGQVVTKKLSVQ